MGDAAVWAGLAFLVALAATGGFLLGRSGLFSHRLPTVQAAGPAELMAALTRDLINRAAPLDLLPGGAEPPQIVLRPPLELLALPRRKHARKRVSDPRFVHVRLWAADAETSRLFFPEATPDIWINAYEDHGSGKNAVTNISPGGLAMEVRAALVPQGLEPGSPVVLKCSLFQFKDKQFKPYWYAGLVRGISTPDDKTRRIAIGFIAVGALDGSAPQGVRWTERIVNETQGGSA